MWAASAKGEGMSFYVRLPVTKVLGVSLPAQDQKAEPKTSSLGRALVVDDEATIRQVVAKGLHDDFEQVDQAPNGEVALDMIRTSHYDCILLDLKMPGISGQEVFERTIRYDSKIADCIVIMTGDTASPETASFLSSLRNAVIHKPFTLNDLREILEIR